MRLLRVLRIRGDFVMTYEKRNVCLRLLQAEIGSAI